VLLEFANPGGSVKDRVALYLIRAAVQRGDLLPDDTIVEATSGNAGIAFAWVGRALGYRVRIYMPEHMSVERRRAIEALGAELELTPRAGGFEEPIARRDAWRGVPGAWVPDQFSNPDNATCHRLHTAARLLEGLREAGVERLDAFVAGTGTGGTLMGVGRALRETWPQVRRVAVEPAESAVMSGGPPGEHGIQGIGDGFVPPLVDPAQIDDVVVVSTQEAHEESRRILREHGRCVGRSAGANFLAARRLAAQGLVVATLWPDGSERYGSFGLEPPGSPAVRCPRRDACAARTQRLAGS
jgi:cysteine synthase A